MCASHQRQTIVVVERLGDVLPERVTRAARRNAPPAAVVRVRPQQVAHGALVRDLLHAVDAADVVERVDRGRQAAVQTEDLAESEERA